MLNKEEKRDANAHLKAFLKGKITYRNGYESIETQYGFMRVPKMRAVVSFTDKQVAENNERGQ